MTTMIQLSDVHLRASKDARIRGNSPEQRFQGAMSAIAKESCDFLLLAGDVSDDGSHESYQRVIEACDALGCEWEWIPGNHDNPTVMNELKPLLIEKKVGDWSLFGLNSWVPDWDGGALDNQQLQRLEQQLSKVTSPAMVAVHHPPVTLYPDWMNDISLRDKKALLEIIQTAPVSQKVVLSGHIHHALEQKEGDVRILTSPGCIDQFSIESQEFQSEDDVLPGYLRLQLTGNSLESEVVRFSF